MAKEKQAWIFLIILSLIWGSSFILMEKSMKPSGEELVMGPFQVGALRIAIAGLVLLPFALRHLHQLKGKKIMWLTIVGACGNLIPAMLFTWAETRIDSSLAGLLNMGTSFFVVLIGILVYRNKPSWLQFLGIGLGALGLFQILKTQISFESDDLNYALLVLLATLCYGISLTTIKFKLGDTPPLVVTALSFFIVFFPAIIITITTGAFEPVLNHPDGLKSIGYLSLLSIVGTALAVFIFNHLVASSNHIFASGVTYLIPLVAIFIGVLDGEKFALFNILWVIIILMGVYLMNKKKKAESNKST